MLHRASLVVFLLNSACVLTVQAGGSGLNTVVVVNQCSSNSCELGNYYCERRQVPPENVLRICWTGGNTLWTSNDLQVTLLTPLLDMLAARQLTNQIDYVVLSMDIPFQTSFGATVNGTTSALFYGLKSSGELAVASSYAASEAVFHAAQPTNNPGYSFLSTMITAQTLSQAKQLVDQGVNGDGMNPTQAVVLAKSSDSSRNLRYTLFDNAIFNVNVLGVSSILRTNTDSVSWLDSLGLETGLATFSLGSNVFAAGAIADSLTSFGGIIFGPNSQTNLLAFINAGAAGSYGTVAEPGTDREKFPNPQVYFYQARGFSLAESYYQSLNVPYLGLMVAEPLAAPFARAGQGEWATNLPNSVLSNTALLSVQFSAADGGHPLQQIDLFVDGRLHSTLTNLPPAPGNRLTVTLKGYPITYTVPSNATLRTIATGLTALINDPAATNATKVKALARGDRIELRSMTTNTSAFPYYVADANSTNSPGSSYRVTYLPESFPPRMISLGSDDVGVFRMQVEIPTALHYVIQASTNLVDWTPIATNAVPGLVDVQDVDAAEFPTRFYRVVGPVPDQPPRISAPGLGGDGSFQMHVETEEGQPCAIEVSTNLVDWASVLTNQPGGPVDFTDTDATNFLWRSYRARRVLPKPPGFTVLDGGTNGTTQVRIDGAVLPYTVEASTNGNDWTGIFTNFSLSDGQTVAGSEIGGGDELSTFLTASRSTFLTSEACGFQAYNVITSTPAIGAWLQMTITKTNNSVVVVGVTNQSGGMGSVDFVQQLCQLINTRPALQGIDGVVAEDFAVNLGGVASFNLRARSPGHEAALLQVFPKRSTSPLGPTILPASLGALTNNLSDLQARNHLYVTAGAAGLALSFPFDTTALADGYHDLTAVAYEGSHAQTQTRVTMPVRVRNSPLSATLTLLDLPDTASVLGTYHIEVAANTNVVSAITLFSTGGALNAVTNQSTATFQVDGTNLWVGLHPFYALVESSSGLTYRTETHWVRFVSEP